MEIDYKDLLKKYISHVRECEGVSFINGYGVSDISFSKEELEELKRIEAQIDSEWQDH
jgi:hypothetical protein